VRYLRSREALEPESDPRSGRSCPDDQAEHIRLDRAICLASERENRNPSAGSARAGSTVDSGDVVAKDEHLAEALALLRDTPVNSLNTFQLKNCYRHLASFQRGRVIGAVEAQGRDCSGRTAGRRGVAV
jgi:hypothetical protein